MPKTELQYPIYEDQEQRENDLMPHEIQTISLTAFFQRLECDRHYIYALFDSLPKSLFSIVRYSGYIDELSNRTTYNLQEFRSLASTFHPGDYFLILFVGVKLCHVEEIDDKTISHLYASRIALLCERRMRGNNPVVLSPSLAARYGLTDEDITQIEPLISKCNARAAAKLQSEYDAMKTLDCIRK